MKNNSLKRLICLLATVALICATIFAFAACGDPDTEEGEKTMTLVVVNAEGTATVVTDKTTEKFIDKWLIELNAESKITLSYVTGSFGMDIRTLNGISVDGGTSSYFAFYSNDANNTNSDWGYSYDSKTYASCALGQSEMPAKNGKTYLLVYTAFNA